MKKGRTRTVDEARELDRDAKKSERARSVVKRITTEPRPRGRGKLGELARSQRDGGAWVGHSKRDIEWITAFGTDYDDEHDD